MMSSVSNSQHGQVRQPLQQHQETQSGEVQQSQRQDMQSSQQHQQHQQHQQQHQQQQQNTGNGGGGPQNQNEQNVLRNRRRTIIPMQLQMSFNRCCAVGYDPITEQLEYDYTRDDAKGKQQSFPRTRQKGEMYIDSFNADPWGCSFGTAEDNGIWMNSGDQAGTIMASLVWLLMLYSVVTVTLLSITEGLPVSVGMIYCVLCFMALSCHAKTSLSDPGSVPRAAVPCETHRATQSSHSMCGQCQTFKPPFSHHCRICNRCVSRMDHHCPWMNNCVGAGNLKHFLLFLVYTWTCSAYALCLFGWNYFFCGDDDCTFHPYVVHLVRIMTILCIGAFLFTSSMLMNVTYGLMTGIGTIDRLKKKATNTMSQSDEEPIPLVDVFGVAGYHTWPFPIDPIFENYDRVMGFSMPQRLAREQQLMEYQRPVPDLEPSPTVELPQCVNDLLPV